MGDNQVGHDLTVTKNTTTTSTGDTGDIGVDNNTVGHNATCIGNSPIPAPDGIEDGPNTVDGPNTGC